jgi:dTDP-glucose 4,6-dehydratase
MSSIDDSYSRRVLVTGGAGFIGSNFLNYMLGQDKYSDWLFVNIDKLDYCASAKNVVIGPSESGNYIFVKGDINSSDLVSHILVTHQIDTVVHFAAQSHVCNSFSAPMKFTMDNIVGTHTLLEAVKRYNDDTNNLQKFIHVSTDEVYGDQHDGKSVSESSILMPTNCYAASKAAAEMIVRSYQISFNLPIIITRGNNVYGPRQYPEKIIPKFILQLLQGQRCTIHGDGSTRRNFLYVDDVARAFETILLSGEIGMIYNIGTDDEYAVMDIAEILRHKIVPDKKLTDVIVYVDDRNINDKRYLITSDPLRLLGWSESTTFQQGIDKTIEWYRANGMIHWH